MEKELGMTGWIKRSTENLCSGGGTGEVICA